MAVVSLGQTHATQNTGVFFDVCASGLTSPSNLVGAHFQPYIFYNSDQDSVFLQLYTCGAQSFGGLETSRAKWRLIGSGYLDGMEELRLSQPINIQAGETHGFCIHAPQRKSLVMLADADAGEHTTEGPITITAGPSVTKKQPFTEVDSADRLYVPRGRLVFEMPAPTARMQAHARTQALLKQLTQQRSGSC